MRRSEPVRVVLADTMAGVRDAWRGMLAGAPDLAVVGEADSVRAATDLPGDVVLSGLQLSDGTAADLAAADARPVVVWTFLPPDERGHVDLAAAAAVLGAGELRAGLVPALRQAAASSASSRGGTPPSRAARPEA